MQDPRNELGKKLFSLLFIFYYAFFPFLNVYAQVVRYVPVDDSSVVTPPAFSNFSIYDVRDALSSIKLSSGNISKGLVTNFSENSIVPHLGFTDLKSIRNSSKLIDFTSFTNSDFKLSYLNSSKLVLTGSVSRRVDLAGAELVNPLISHKLTDLFKESSTNIFSKDSFENHFNTFSVYIPKLVQMQLLPVKQFGLLAFGGNKAEAQIFSNLPTQKKSLPIIDQFSLGLFCKLSSLSTKVDKDRCNYDLLASGLLATNNTSTTNDTTSTQNSSESIPSSATTLFSTTTTIYITKYITVPGERGAPGKDGKDGKADEECKDCKK